MGERIAGVKFKSSLEFFFRGLPVPVVAPADVGQGGVRFGECVGEFQCLQGGRLCGRVNLARRPQALALSGPATRKILYRQYYNYGDQYSCSRSVRVTQSYTSCRWAASNSIGSLASRNARICARLSRSVFFTLMINSQHGAPLLL